MIEEEKKWVDEGSLEVKVQVEYVANHQLCVCLCVGEGDGCSCLSDGSLQGSPKF